MFQDIDSRINKFWLKKLVSYTNSTKKIGVFLPHYFRGGSLQGAKNVAKMILLGSQNNGEKVNVVVSVVSNFYDINQDFSDLLELGIQVRETRWKVITKRQVEIAQKFSNYAKPLNYEEYMIPEDGICNFNDCDLWILISDRVNRPLAPVKPYIVIVYDYIQRRCPQIFEHENIWSDLFEIGLLGTVRGANCVFTTTPLTQNDVITYAGLPPHKVVLAPMEFDGRKNYQGFSKMKGDYIIWTTNVMPHKNHLDAIRALEHYYHECGGKFDLVISGELTHWLDWKVENNFPELAYISKVRECFASSKLLNEKVSVLGNLSEAEYLATLANAKFLWHPALVDNGTFSVIEAAYYKVPALSHDYPPMRYIDQRFGLNLNFCDARDPRNMGRKLKEMEDSYIELRSKLPCHENLERYSYKYVANDFWSLLKKIKYE